MQGFAYDVFPNLLISIPQFLLIKFPIDAPVICLLKSKELLLFKTNSKDLISLLLILFKFSTL